MSGMPPINTANDNARSERSSRMWQLPRDPVCNA